jgi:catechol 2,3-dioxygenase-like lactoylglutathione lyase family enzyme
MQIRRVQHVSIGIDAAREVEARHFYGDVLGLREKRRPLALKDQALIWYDIGDAEDELHLIVIAPQRFTELRAGDHFCIEVEDLAAMADRLHRHHVDILTATEIGGRPRFFVNDPCGNSIEFVEITGPFTAVSQ